MAEKKPRYSTGSKSWNELNAQLMGCTDLKKLQKMMDDEMHRPHPRKQFVIRIHARINKVRAQLEREQLDKKLGAA